MRLKMGVAFDMSAEEAGQTMAEWRTAFKMTQPEVVSLADKVNYLSNTTAASSAKISDIVSRVGPLGAVGGLASGEIAALGATMAAAGTESEVAATGIQKIILAMTTGEGATKSQAAAFNALGLDAVEMAKRMQTDASGALQEVFTRLSQIDKYQQAAVLKIYLVLRALRQSHRYLLTLMHCVITCRPLRINRNTLIPCRPNLILVCKLQAIVCN